MLDNIPFEIQEEIMKRLPIKPLLRFRSVSKAWKSLIDRSEFIAAYQHTELQQHILVSDDFEQNYVCVADDDTFPNQKVTLTVPTSVTQFYKPEILGSSQGLFCLYYSPGEPSDFGTRTAVIWNPTIKKSIAIDVPVLLDSKKKFYTHVGFGVCPQTLDPMLVKISIEYCLEGVSSTTDTTWRVKVFRLSLGTWKSLSINLPRRTIELLTNQVAIDRFIYWDALDRISMTYLVISFDMISEEFREIRLPDNLTLNLLNRDMWLYICKFKESLAVIHSNYEVEPTVWDVWMMENGDPESFRKIYTIKSDRRDDDSIVWLFGSRKSGEPLVEVRKCSGMEKEDYALFVYNPNSEQNYYIGISAKQPSFVLIKSCSMAIEVYEKLVDINVSDMYKVQVEEEAKFSREFTCETVKGDHYLPSAEPGTALLLARAVEVIRLSSGTWKSLYINLPRRTIAILSIQHVLGKYDIMVFMLGKYGIDPISFDMISEEFREIRLPDNLALKLLDCDMRLYICKFKESLVVIHFEFDVDVTDWDVWMMENGDPESFRKIYTIKSDIRDDDLIVSVFGSRKSGEPLVEVTKCFSVEKEGFELFIYNPNSEHIDYIGISAKRSSFVVKAYTETLLLLDR
ncbi:putative F-box domain-containing protein [Tanacetum coccineum]